MKTKISKLLKDNKSISEIAKTLNISYANARYHAISLGNHPAKKANKKKGEKSPAEKKLIKLLKTEMLTAKEVSERLNIKDYQVRAWAKKNNLELKSSNYQGFQRDPNKKEEHIDTHSSKLGKTMEVKCPICSKINIARITGAELNNDGETYTTRWASNCSCGTSFQLTNKKFGYQK